LPISREHHLPLSQAYDCVATTDARGLIACVMRIYAEEVFLDLVATHIVAAITLMRLKATVITYHHCVGLSWAHAFPAT